MLGFFFELLVEKDDDILQPGNVSEHLKNDSDGIYEDGQWLNISIDKSMYDAKFEIINITLPHRLIYQILNQKLSTRLGGTFFLVPLEKSNKKLTLN
ncbi:type II toxin-antitoxin system HicB family antitoxin [Thorsellia anophelis]|uniref:HicB_like antitoxin of toxin-antitoxin system n=1 Tax=Thorsellia anophelis DSM 18579 TaxID=1123402 RepID=A0A1I0A0U5_9GAMM|nr:type II toxin-antitoxin system HicB family antitoxin [Thorsellia anophelis]SES87290.1 HicB_like antitoxin of toxin-antitoxin system [Thorsellia anophelis DSM 18579]